MLVVDDDATLRDLLRIVLEHAGHTPVTAASAKDAAPQIADADLVILDLMMPDVTGIELLRSLEGTEHPPVLVLTALTDNRTRDQCLAAGAAAVLSKPFERADLLAEVDRLLP